MATLESYGREVHSIFQLLGEKENDITWIDIIQKYSKYFCPVGGKSQRTT